MFSTIHFRAMVPILGLLAIVTTSERSWAIVITNVVIQNQSEANVDNITSNILRQFKTSATVNSPGGSAPDTIDSTVTAATQFRAFIRTDSDNLSEWGAQGRRVQYRMSFTVHAPAEIRYNLVIHSLILGQLSVENDTGVDRSIGEVGFQNFMVSLNSVPNSTLTRSNFEQDLESGYNTSTLVTRNIRDDAWLSFQDLSGNQTFTLDFLWRIRSVSGEPLSPRGRDAIGSFGYTNFNLPNFDNGHFVNISAKVVPETSTLALLTYVAFVGYLGRRWFSSKS